ncbi:MAG: 2-dehydro-3-deoxygalactonokinase [Burkholderiales bacterium]|nr:2-dehydro-3-deoxygalactonokinase [Burkholderiales bacterium]
MTPGTALVAIDWGTTSARAYRLDGAGCVVDTRVAPLGVSQVEAGRFADALAALLGDWAALPIPRIACGMIGSRQGWVEAPYLDCPVALAALADALVPVPGVRLLVVPGLRSRDAGGMPDVMRGEETQVLGAAVADAGPTLFVLPGTHSKWVYVDQGRVVDFVTYMTGELWHVLLQNSILGRLASTGAGSGGSATSAFQRGATRGAGSGSVLHDVFGARTHALVGELDGDDVADWLSGLLIGREVRDARQWAHRHGLDASRVHVVGDDALVARYAAVFRACDVAAVHADRCAAAFGLWRIAVQAGLVHSDQDHP